MSLHVMLQLDLSLFIPRSLSDLVRTPTLVKIIWSLSKMYHNIIRVQFLTAKLPTLYSITSANEKEFAQPNKQ